MSKPKRKFKAWAEHLCGSCATGPPAVMPCSTQKSMARSLLGSREPSRMVLERQNAPPVPQRNGKSNSAAELAAVRKHLEHRAEANLVISQWRYELRTRLARARLKDQKLIGLHDEEHAALVAEVHDFKRLCRILGWLGRWQS